MASRPTTTRRPSVVCFENRCTVIPDGPPIKPRLAKRTLSIPLSRKPPSDFIYDPTFIASPQKCLKIPMWRMSNAPPHATSQGRRMSHNDARPNLKGCLVRNDSVQKDYTNQSHDDHSQNNSDWMRKISRVRSLDEYIRDEDPMSVLPVRRIETSQAPQPNTPEPVALDHVALSPQDSVLGTSPVDAPSRPGLFGGIKRPSFLRRRTSSIDRKPGLGPNLTRWTSNGPLLNPAGSGASTPQAPDMNRLTQIPQSISEHRPLVTAPQYANIGHLRSHDLPPHRNAEPAGGQYLTLRPCCKQCQRATDKGLRSDWVPPVSRSAQRLLDAEAASRHVESRIRTIGEAEDEAEAELEYNKTCKVMVDEVEILRRRRNSTASLNTCSSPIDDRNTLTDSNGTVRPAPGPVWLCSRRSPKSGFSAEPSNGVQLGQQEGDYFSGRNDGDANDGRIQAALEAEVRDNKRNQPASEEEETNETSCKPRCKTDWLSSLPNSNSGGSVFAV